MEPRTKKRLLRAAYGGGVVVSAVISFALGRFARLHDWDLTQPQAVLIAGFASGFFLVAAAWIAFHGQKQNRLDERQRHIDQLNVQREGWAAEHKAVSDRAYRDEVRGVYRAAIRASRKVHILSIELDRAERSGRAAVDVEHIGARFNEALAEVMVMDEELTMVSSPEVNEAYKEVVDKVEINADRKRTRAAAGELLDEAAIHETEGLFTALASRMGEHLDFLRPVSATSAEPSVETNPATQQSDS
ncbi:hypothetical protein ACFRFQ_17760 [Rhodococcus sp. NPDC056743]|uniref:hypothetical protein n=1 Tax=Rhodococcus sp. NPDC056743 TaxID=3345934 RepID=UPI00366F3C54